MSYVVLVTVALLVQYTFFSMRAGMMRDKKGIEAPAVSGNEEFERCLRVQMNTLEQLAVTLPAMWICAVYFRADLAAILGLIFLIGRFIFSAGYISSPPKRAPGMIIGFLANAALVLCCLYVGVMGLL